MRVKINNCEERKMRHLTRSKGTKKPTITYISSVTNWRSSGITTNCEIKRILISQKFYINWGEVKSAPLPAPWLHPLMFPLTDRSGLQLGIATLSPSYTYFSCYCLIILPTMRSSNSELALRAISKQIRKTQTERVLPPAQRRNMEHIMSQHVS
jgi:hypothetical protein